jgi:release factor glutamine methyltransferase
MTLAEMFCKYQKELSQIYDSAEATSIAKIAFSYVLGVDWLSLELHRQKLLSAGEMERLNIILNRLCQHEPLQYILGETEFMGMRLTVNSSTLIPRPETEELIEWIIEICGDGFKGTILDIGTGTGCIAIALKKFLPHSEVSACDISRQALQVAAENARLHSADITFFPCDVLKVFSMKTSFDVIVSNPPYIPINEQNTIAENVLHFEPHLALFVPEDDPLIFYRKICQKCREGWLNPNGKIFFEVHFQKAADVQKILLDYAFRNISIKKDLSGKPRMVFGIYEQ